MKKFFLHFIKIIIFYSVLFLSGRIIFLFFNSVHQPFSVLIFIYGLRMDLSVISYTLLATLIFYGLYLIRPLKIFDRINFHFHRIMILIFCLIIPANILVYHYWTNLLNFRALTYLQDASELPSSFTIVQILIFLVILILFLFIVFFCFKRYAYNTFTKGKSTPAKKTVSWISMTAITIILLRGGLQMLPMNESLVSFSEDLFLNQATVNPAWHLMNDIYRAGIFEGNPFEVTTDAIAKERVEKLFECSPDSFPKIFSTQRPNIVFIIIESFTSDVIASLGGEKNITPNFDRLAGGGILFNHIYASGTRTDQGIVSMLNGWPATPFYSIMRSTDKCAQLPSIPMILLKKGYATSFYYGGKSNFSNMNVYLLNQKFETIVDENGFSGKIPRGRWGVHDEYVFEKQIDDLNSAREPFFSAVMTLSNHEPFDVPGVVRFPGNSDPGKFRNSAAYTDYAIGKFFEEAKKQSWYKNTLFVLAADHGHSLPENHNVYFPETHRIPLLFYGDVIAPEFRGAIVTKLGGHHDVAGTLFAQLSVNESRQFRWSKNLLNPTAKPFAYYSIDQLTGWIDPHYWYGYSYSRNKFIGRSYNVPENHLEKMKGDGQAFVQELYEQYRSY